MEHIPSGSIVVDMLLGGGIPAGRYIEFASDAGLGKSHLALHICREFLGKGKKCYYLDIENALNESLIEAMGLNTWKGETFGFSQPAYYDDVEEVLDSLLIAPVVDLIVIDSITAIKPNNLRIGEGSVTDIRPGEEARLDNLMLKKYKDHAASTGTTVIFINQVRTKISFGFGRQESTVEGAGGFAMKHYMDARFMMTKGAFITTGSKPNEVKVGCDAHIWSPKNKFTKPMQRMDLAIIYGKGGL